MNTNTPTGTHLASLPIAIAALAAVVLSATALSVRAGAPFGSDGSWVKQIFCELTTVTGTFNSTQATYRASGQCVQLEAFQRDENLRGGGKSSEFPNVNRSKELFRAAWTAQGSYNPVTKETWEKVTMPAPAIDQKSSPGRPYGTYETRMICATDPWLTGLGVKCTGKTAQANGNVGDMAAMLGALNQPLTTPNKQPLLQALNASHDRYVRMHSFASTTEATSKGSAAAAMFAPTIVEPKPGSTHRPQTAMSIRVAAAQSARDTHYILNIEQMNGPEEYARTRIAWSALTNIPVTAAVAQTGLGYKGWGAHVDGTGPQMTASRGTYRVRALATAPSRSVPGEWVEFKIAGTPGVTKDDLARSKLGTTNGARAAFGLPAKAAANEAPRTQAYSAPLTAPAQATLSATANKADAVALNPQPLPPKQSSTPSPLEKATRKADAVSLNPQPLPPKAAGKGDAVSLNPQPLPPKAAGTPSPLSKAATKGDAVSLNPQPLPPVSPVLLLNQAPSALR